MLEKLHWRDINAHYNPRHNVENGGDYAIRPQHSIRRLYLSDFLWFTDNDENMRRRNGAIGIHRSGKYLYIANLCDCYFDFDNVDEDTRVSIVRIPRRVRKYFGPTVADLTRNTTAACDAVFFGTLYGKTCE